MHQIAYPKIRGHYRGRFAPSPTGPLHLGSLIAALGSYLEARTRGGEWLVRMEDIDTPRIVPGASSEILRVLEACGMQWDGPVVQQSERTEAYHAALHMLAQRGITYPCACSRREIADSAVQGIEGRVYPGTCRDGSPTERRARALRLRTQDARVEFDDVLQGAVTQDLEADVGDFVLYRSDGIYAYQIAVVIDDAEQGITDVVRGADLLHSTPRQIYLQRLLRLPHPRYLHLPVAVNAHGEKLSKQTKAPPIDRDQPTAAVLAALRFLGQSPPARLQGARPGEVLQWAMENWRSSSIARARALTPHS
jgi:glutamyl-Q tRNA(Asp) synthetase